MFLSPYRKNSYSQGVSCRLDDFKCLYSSWYEILLELRKEDEWLGHVQCCVKWGMCTGLSGILNCNGQWSAIFWAFMYTMLHTQSHTHCCHRSLNSLSHTSLHSQYSNTVNISTVVTLGFWLCQFNTGSLTWELCLSSTTEIFVWLLHFNICGLGYGSWCLWFEFWFGVFCANLRTEGYVSQWFCCLSMSHFSLPVILMYQHGFWNALNICAVIVMLFSE